MWNIGDGILLIDVFVLYFPPCAVQPYFRDLVEEAVTATATVTAETSSTSPILSRLSPPTEEPIHRKMNAQC